MAPRIFISYRRDDAAGDAGRLADHLLRRFGAGCVFLDIDTVDPGTDFVRVLHASLQETAVMLVVIGPRWVSLRSATGARRLDDPNDFVRLEVERALARGIPVVPVLVQGATLPRKDELPPPLVPLVTRQVFAIDHAEFHADAERLCDRLAPTIDAGETRLPALVRRWWPVAAVVAVLAVALIAYLAVRTRGGEPPPASTNATSVEGPLAEASAQRRRGQFVEALATLARARDAAPAAASVREMQEDVAMEWIRNVRVENGTSSFGEAIKPALAVVDAALATATGPRRADLLAHSGWATFLMWRDGNRQLNPADWYDDALSLDPANPYANAMLAHWILFRGDDVPRAVELFGRAARAGRALDAVRTLQWAAYGNASSVEADVERVRLANAIRRDGQRLRPGQAQALWPPYYFAMPSDREEARQRLLEALPPDDHISTLGWAFEEYAANDESRRQIIRYYIALLHARAGRADEAAGELRTLDKELAESPGALRDAVQAALTRLGRA